MATDNNNSFQFRAYSLKELAGIYGVDIRTIKKWLIPFAAELGPKCGRFYSVIQIKVIFGKLGVPIMANIE